MLAEARRELPDVDLLVIDDGSTDATAEVARAGGALRRVSFPENRGLRHGIAEGYRRAPTAATTTAAASTPTASIRPRSSRACS